MPKLTFVIHQPYSAGKHAGHQTIEYDTELEQFKREAAAEFERLTRREGRLAFLEREGQEPEVVHKLPEEGKVTFLLPMMGV